MKKTLFLTLLLSIAFGLLLYSCRTEDEAVVSENRNNTKSASFQVFKDHSSQYARRGGSMFYQEGFRDLYLSYYKDHPEEAPDADGSDFHIDFRRASQVLYGADSTRYVLFPYMKGNEVKYVVACSVNNSHDYISFYFPERNEIVGNAIAAFSLASRSSVMNRGERCGFEGEPPCEIEEITIKGPTKEVTHTLSPGTPYGFDPNYQFPPSGGCETYNNCGGGGGTSTQPTPPPPLSPCDKTKAITTNPKMQAGLQDLKAQSKISGEIGYKFKADGTPSSKITGGEYEVDLGDEPGYQGGYHNHPPDGIKMHSPADIVKMLNFALAQPNGNVGDGYLGMIGSEVCGTCPDGYKYYHYIISYSGPFNELSGFVNNNWDLEGLRGWYANQESLLARSSSNSNNDGTKLNNMGLEKLFFDTLKKMGIEGKVNLQRIDNSSTIQNITLDSNGEPNETPCPN